MATIGSIGKQQDLLIRQGATFGPVEVFLANPDGSAVDMTGSTIRAQMRRKALDDTVAAEFEATIVNSETVSFVYGMSAANTASIPAGESRGDRKSQYVWDLEWEDALGRVTPLFYGAVTVFREVTRG